MQQQTKQKNNKLFWFYRPKKKIFLSTTFKNLFVLSLFTYACDCM